MKEINIVDSNFAHHKKTSVADHQDNAMYKWCRRNEVVSNVCFFTDLHLKDVDAVKSIKRKVAWLLEPRAINPNMYQWIRENNRKFDFVLTFDKELLDLGQNYLFYPFGVTWIQQKDAQRKTKKVSIIGSNKSMTPGHEFRRQVIEHCLKRGDVDVYGRGYNEIACKEQGLCDYKFSIVMENSQADWYFSEKLIDCFVTNTVPIYWGCDISKFFNEQGIYKFNTLSELDKVLDSINDEIYNNLSNIINENKDIVTNKLYDIPEHWLMKNYEFLFN